MEFNIWVGILCFITTGLLDVAWALYVRRTAAGLAFQSALYAMYITILSAVNTIAYIQNHLNLIFSIGGAFVGTYFIVKWEHKKN